jgi:hypothetical protein
MIAMAVMPAVPAMHEHMHERASEDRKPNEDAKHMRAVLREQQRTRDDQKSDQYEPHPRKQQARHVSLLSGFKYASAVQ